MDLKGMIQSILHEASLFLALSKRGLDDVPLEVGVAIDPVDGSATYGKSGSGMCESFLESIRIGSRAALTGVTGECEEGIDRFDRQDLFLHFFLKRNESAESRIDGFEALLNVLDG